jgi:hypothetical protein
MRILKVIFLESNPLWFIKFRSLEIMFIYARLKIKLFVFVFREQTTCWCLFERDAMRYCVEYKIPMRMDKYPEASRAFQRILNCQSSHMNIFDMRTMILCPRNEKK